MDGILGAAFVIVAFGGLYTFARYLAMVGFGRRRLGRVSGGEFANKAHRRLATQGSAAAHPLVVRPPSELMKMLVVGRHNGRIAWSVAPDDFRGAFQWGARTPDPSSIADHTILYFQIHKMVR
jgi:hypothetical protein